MKSRFFLAFFLALTMPIAASAAAGAPTIYMPGTIHWMPGTGPLAGAQMAVLFGDPAKAGPYTVRLKVPDGVKLGVHFHGGTERVTVISGTFMVGIGAKMSAHMTALPAGTFAVVPAGLKHYGMAKGDTVLQVDGMGPMSMTMVKGK